MGNVVFHQDNPARPNQTPRAGGHSEHEPTWLRWALEHGRVWGRRQRGDSCSSSSCHARAEARTSAASLRKPLLTSGNPASEPNASLSPGPRGSSTVPQPRRTKQQARVLQEHPEGLGRPVLTPRQVPRPLVCPKPGRNPQTVPGCGQEPMQGKAK